MEEPFDRIFDPGIFLKLKELSLLSFAEDPRPICQNYQLLTFLLNRSRRGVGVYSNNMLQDRVLPVLPYMENDYFHYVLSIPNHLRLNYQLYNRIIAELMPGPDILPTNRMPVDLNAYPRRKRIIDYQSTIDYLFNLVLKNPLPSGLVNWKERDRWIQDVKKGKKNPFLRIRPYLYFSLWYNRYFNEGHFNV